MPENISKCPRCTPAGASQLRGRTWSLVCFLLRLLLLLPLGGFEGIILLSPALLLLCLLPLPQFPLLSLLGSLLGLPLLLGLYKGTPKDDVFPTDLPVCFPG